MPTVTSRSSPPFERLPRPLALQLEEAGQLPSDGQDHHHHVLGDGAGEDASGVRDDDAALAGRRRQRPFDAGRGRVDPDEARGPGEQAIECIGRQPAMQQHLDVVDRVVGEALHRERHDPGAGRRRADPLEIAGPIAGRQDRRQRDRGRNAAGAAPRPGRPGWFGWLAAAHPLIRERPA